MDPSQRLDLVTKVLLLLDGISAKALPDRENLIHLGQFKKGELTLRVDRMKKPERLIVIAGGTRVMDASLNTVRQLQPDYLVDLHDKLKAAIAMMPDN